MSHLQEETPFAHHDRRMHDYDAHFWATSAEPSLYERMREHYTFGAERSEHDLDPSHWRGYIQSPHDKDKHFEDPHMPMHGERAI